MDLQRITDTFRTSGAAYDAYMGRYSRALAAPFADVAGVAEGQRALDAGCGPGALTGVLVERLGTPAVSAFDPSPPFVADCASRHPGIEIREGQLEAVPFDDASFDVVLAQLVLHFVTDPAKAAREMRRVLRPGGAVAACVWDADGGMELLRRFWDAAQAVDPDAPDEAATRPFGHRGEIAELFEGAGFTGVVETTVEASSTYRDVDELWAGFELGIGPAGAYLVSLPSDQRAAVRAELTDRLGRPDGPFTLRAVARAAVARR